MRKKLKELFERYLYYIEEEYNCEPFVDLDNLSFSEIKITIETQLLAVLNAVRDIILEDTNVNLDVFVGTTALEDTFTKGFLFDRRKNPVVVLAEVVVDNVYSNKEEVEKVLKMFILKHLTNWSESDIFTNEGFSVPIRN